MSCWSCMTTGHNSCTTERNMVPKWTHCQVGGSAHAHSCWPGLKAPSLMPWKHSRSYPAPSPSPFASSAPSAARFGLATLVTAGRRRSPFSINDDRGWGPRRGRGWRQLERVPAERNFIWMPSRSVEKLELGYTEKKWFQIIFKGETISENIFVVLQAACEVVWYFQKCYWTIIF